MRVIVALSCVFILIATRGCLCGVITPASTTPLVYTTAPVISYYPQAVSRQYFNQITKQPYYYQQSPLYYPSFIGGGQYYPQGIFGGAGQPAQNPIYGGIAQDPIYGGQRPIYGGQNPIFGGQYPIAGGGSPAAPPQADPAAGVQTPFEGNIVDEDTVSVDSA